jgi:transposase
MKTYQLKPVCPTHPAILDRLPSLRRRLDAEEAGGSERAFVCLGGDLEKAGVCLAIQIGAGGVCAHGMFSRQEAAALVSELLARGWPVAVGVEACGFGWRFQAQLREAGATVFSFATEPLTGRRKNNRRDAAALESAAAMSREDDPRKRRVRGSWLSAAFLCSALESFARSHVGSASGFD